MGLKISVIHKQVAGETVLVRMLNIGTDIEEVLEVEVVESTPKTITTGNPINRTFFRNGKQRAPWDSDTYHRVSYKLVKGEK